ncbi:MAG: DNA polymerase III subunit alpha [Sterolibacterium sp.]
MSHADFVHLRVHTAYSLLEGAIRAPDLIKLAAAKRMPAVAMTDTNNMFGALEFSSYGAGAGVQPILGCQMAVGREEAGDRFRTAPAGRAPTDGLVLLAQSEAGYRNLLKLLKIAYLDAAAEADPQVTLADVEAHAEGIIALTGGPAGPVGRLLADGQRDAAEALLGRLAGAFPGRLYVELMRHGMDAEAAIEAALIELAYAHGLPLVATNEVFFAGPDMYEAHDALICIAGGAYVSEGERRRLTPEHYFKSAEEMRVLFADLPEAVDNTLVIARRCAFMVEKVAPILPPYDCGEGQSETDVLRAKVKEGLEAHLTAQVLRPEMGEAERLAAAKPYRERMGYELGVIIEMGFTGYFLIVAEFIQWAKAHGIPVGPGRGSGAGSLVAYSLGITDLDPLAYDLLFERFLNPERVSMPDFDVDFCQEGRDRVIDYVKKKYGAHAVAQIATFGTMATKAVIRDVGRVLDLPFNFVDQFAKLIPNELGITLAQAREKEPAIAERVDTEEELRQLWALAERLEGLTRNVGMHAGGVLIAPGKLTDFCPLYSAQGAVDGETQAAVSQFDKDDVEKMGLVKFDFLGLRTLTILDEAVRHVRRLNPEMAAFRLEDIPLDDKPTYALFSAGNTTAVFQSESRSAKDLERRLKGDNFEDIIALMALNRPGPLQSGMVDDFINRKNGKARAEYFHPDLEPVLKPTYGVIVYQEQVMLVAQVLAGYTLGGADLLRRAMGKKKAEEMAQQRAIFTEGAIKRGVEEKLATHLFDLMEKFAEYGFNKSHSAAYALVAFQTAWLKHYHAAAFMAATLSSELADTDKVQLFHQDSIANGIAFLPPDINAGGIRFEPVDARTIRYGLGAIKGTGEAALGAILRARQGDGSYAPFTDLFDFCRRIDKRTVNRRVIEALIRAGAFDSLDDHRAKLLASVGVALDAAEQAERNALQAGLFDCDGGGTAQMAQYVAVPRWSERERLLNEKQALGFFLSGHPFHACRAELATFVKKSLAQIEAQREPALLAGIVVSTRTQMTRRGKMAIVMLDDATAQLEVSVFNELFEAARAKIKEDDLLLVEGKVTRDDFSGGLRVVADKLMTLGEARGRFARELSLSMNGHSNAEKLRALLDPYRSPGNGACPVRLRYRNGAAEVELGLSDAWRVRPDDSLLAALHEWLSAENVSVVYS